MRRVHNPFLGNSDYNCFGCNPNNPVGLGMEFHEEEGRVISYWQPRPEFQGFTNVLHGGIQATLMDELASWYIFVTLQTSGMTESLSVRYHAPVKTDGPRLMLSAELQEQRKRRVDILVKLFQGDEEKPKSEGVCTYVIFPEEMARKRLNYPGVEAFLPESR